MRVPQPAKPRSTLIRQWPRAFAWVEATAFACSISAMLWYAAVQIDVFASQKVAAMFATGGLRVQQGERKQTDVIGKITIPALKLSAPITNDIDRIELVRGVGHVPGTAFAGGLGTMGLAGHRDTFFRALRSVRPGMQVLISSDAGRYRYVVDNLQVVDPADVDVLMIQSKPKLVLITCYPFGYIGAAPKRFIVTATLTSLLADAK